MSRPTHDQVSTQLESLNGRQIDDSSMADAERKRSNAPDGYCEGVTLDWIRRVLQGGRVSFKPSAKNGDNSDQRYLQKVQSQAARQAVAFSNWEPIKVDWAGKFDDVKKQAEQKWNQKFTDQAARLQNLHKGLFALLSNDPNPQVVLTPKLVELIGEFFTAPVSNMMDRNKLLELFETEIPQLKKNFAPPPFDPKRDKVRQIHQGLQQHAWAEFSKKLDAVNTRKRKFSKLSLLVAGPTVDDLALAGVAEKLELIGATALQDQRAVKINLGGKQRGKLFYHSTAAYLNGRVYFFLDPNYGVFAYAEWRQVMKAILYLYTKVYNWTGTPAVQDIPFPHYKMQFDVFGPKA